MTLAGLRMTWLHLLFFFSLLDGQVISFPFSAKPSSSWKTSAYTKHETWVFNDNSTFRPILLVNDYQGKYYTPPFGFGFFVNGSLADANRSFYLVVFMLLGHPVNSAFVWLPEYPPVVVWSANRVNPVRENAILDFTADGDLVLEDFGGGVVWSTNTSGQSVTNFNLTAEGNLILSNSSNFRIWESFHYPTDTWLRNQSIQFGKRLTSRSSSSNLSTGIYYLSVDSDGIYTFFNSVPHRRYGKVLLPDLVDGSFAHATSHSVTFDFRQNYVRLFTDNFQFIVLEPNGHLNAYKLGVDYSEIQLSSNLLDDDEFGECMYLVCGKYSVCSNGRCTCPGWNQTYFTLAPGGCSPVIPLSCNPEHHRFLELQNVTTSFFELVLDMEVLDMDKESCKNACLNDCSCKVALFRSYNSDVSSSRCYLPSEIYSLMTPKLGNAFYSSFAFIKVQTSVHQIETSSPDRNAKKKTPLNLLLGVSLSVGMVIIMFVFGLCYYSSRVSRQDHIIEEEEDDDHEEQAIGGLTKFSFLELRFATQGFERRIGRGGFGSVYEGVLSNGTKVAVKRLNSIAQGRKEFLAEVNTIGSIHHFCLVRLVGYCAERSNRLLVYEYMCNGSLDKWIFIKENQAQTLTWEIRRKIIHGIATGLEYLHVHCNPNIIHFDIKPQNILLDGDFNVKISDFGLAKLINRDQSQVWTTLKGTPGYMAPELFKGTNISVKADVFSFGIVILEIVCGRKNIDSSTQSESLVDMVKEKAKSDRLDDLVDEDMQFHYREEAIKMIKIAMWCLQTHDRRPSMSIVMKALQGFIAVEAISDYGFLDTHQLEGPSQPNTGISMTFPPPAASALSGPR